MRLRALTHAHAEGVYHRVLDETGAAATLTAHSRLTPDVHTFMILALASCLTHRTGEYLPREPGPFDALSAYDIDTAVTGRVRVGARLYATPSIDRPAGDVSDGLYLYLMDGVPEPNQEWARVQIDSRAGLDLTLFARIVDLVPLTPGPTFVPWTGDSRTGVLIAQGVPLDLPTGADCAPLLVSIPGSFDATVCVPRESLGLGYAPLLADTALPGEPARIATDDVALYRDNDSAPFFHLADQHLIRVIDRRDGQVLVDFYPRVLERFGFRAWVSADTVEQAERSELPPPYNFCGGAFGPRTQPLPLGTALFDAPFGNAIGYVVRRQMDQPIALIDVTNGWTHVTVPSDIGPVAGWFFGVYSPGDLYPSGQAPAGGNRTP